MNRCRGITFIETLVAAVLLAISITGLVGLWNVSYVRIQHSAEANQAGELARAELERAKVYGAANLPTGTYSSGAGSWSGVYDPTANSGAGGYVQSGFTYYNIQGTQVANASATGAAYKLQLTITDTSVERINNGSTYTVDFRSRRAIVATVWRVSDSSVLFQSGTNVVVGGF